MKSHYETLGLSHNASKKDIDAAWRRAVAFWHPDRNRSVEAAERIKQVNAARHVLMNDARRLKYDLANGFRSPGEPHMRPPSAERQKARPRSAPRSGGAGGSKRRQEKPAGGAAKRPAQAQTESFWQRIVDTLNADKSMARKNADQTVTLFERRPGLTKYVLVPLGLTAIFLAAAVTVIVT